jgi:hypothetical protein|tara:strand:- start:14 stop:562 length:549 start_codon:yes stop_codon:yes gene_type:complete
MALKIAEGWINLPEIGFVLKQMTSPTGNILEVGAANGRLFSFLHHYKPKWKYTAIDPWEIEGQWLQVDWKKRYWDPGNAKKVITIDMFKSNCPYAETHQTYFENFDSTSLADTYDIISMGLGSKTRSIDWKNDYNKAFSMLRPNGVIIGRDLTHNRESSRIKEALQDYEILDTCGGSFMMKK